jgi:tryptophanyl-tRNA synthetase
MGELQRMTHIKEKSQGKDRESISLALFSYPVLQAADILLYQADEVPVGEDQRQHIELTRDLADRFNKRFGKTFKLPISTTPVVGARIMDLQNPEQKMSKSSTSQRGTIFMTDSNSAINKKIRSAVTDTGQLVDPDSLSSGVTNLLTIYASLSGATIEMATDSFIGRSYKELKDEVAELAVSEIEPIRERLGTVTQDPRHLDDLLAAGAAKAAIEARKTLKRARTAIGFK